MARPTQVEDGLDQTGPSSWLVVGLVIAAALLLAVAMFWVTGMMGVPQTLPVQLSTPATATPLAPGAPGATVPTTTR